MAHSRARGVQLLLGACCELDREEARVCVCERVVVCGLHMGESRFILRVVRIQSNEV